MEFNEVDGDLIKLAKQGQFDVIGHGCNCLSNMGAGIAVTMKNHFQCDDYPLERIGPDISKLGNIDYVTFELLNGHILNVCNLYTQNRYGRNHADGDAKPVDYEAITLCMRKLNSVFKGKHIGLPKIGAGLAGGDWKKIESIIKRELNNCNVTIVNFVR